MEDILQYTEKCAGVKEVDVTGCSNETVLRAVSHLPQINFLS
jgi:hypothetical protein